MPLRRDAHNLHHPPTLDFRPFLPVGVFSRFAKDDGLSDGDGSVNVYQRLKLVFDSVAGDVKSFDVLHALLLT